MSEPESITSIMDKSLLGLERFVAQEANKGPRRDAAPRDIAGNEESFALDEVIPERHGPSGRDTKCHGQALSEFECETFSPSATESETEFVE